MENKLSIRINIAERFYSLKVDAEEEETVRLAAKNIENKLLSLKQKHTGRDVQDWLAMACLWFSMKLIDAKNNNDLDVVMQGIQSFEKQIAEYLDYAVEK